MSILLRSLLGFNMKSLHQKVIAGIFSCTVALVILLIVQAAPIAAQTPETISDVINNAVTPKPEDNSTQSAELPLEEQVKKLTNQLEAAEDQLDRLAGADPAALATQFGVSPQDVLDKKTLIESLVRVFREHLFFYQRLAEVRRASEELQTEINRWDGFEQPPPYSIDLVDGLRDAKHTRELEIKALNTERQVAGDLLTWKREKLKTAEQDLRRLKEELGDETAGANSAVAQWRIDMAETRRRFREASVAASETERNLLAEDIALKQADFGFLNRKLSVAEANAPFTREELDRKLKTLDEERNAFQKDLDQAIQSNVRALDDLSRSRDALKTARVLEEQTEQHQRRIKQLEQVVETRRVQAETSGIIAKGLNQFGNFLVNMERQVWLDRWQLAQKQDSAGLELTKDQVERAMNQIRNWRPYFDSNNRLSLSQITALRSSLEEWRPEQGDPALVRQAMQSYEEREAFYRRIVGRLNRLERTLDRWVEDVNRLQKGKTTLDHAQNFLPTLWERTVQVWNYELFAVGDRGVTVRKLIFALFILTLGIMLARRITRLIHGALVRRFNLDESVAIPIQKGMYYVLLVAIVFFALDTVEIPLTIFAFLGGAIAIGVGFGAQNLINNFISGLILLLERPVKVGDIVEVEDLRGRVTNIGSRCSNVHLFNGVDILVPNSSFLEKNVTNWTLSDNILRFDVSVGVAYDSSPEKVKELVEKAVHEHEKVLKFPEPLVLFEDFGDNALIFTTYFWLAITRFMDYRITASDLRFRIFELFHEAGITIAFPQRDVHLDSLSPVQVEMVTSGGSPKKPPQE
jgi:potassium efflux system protein